MGRIVARTHSEDYLEKNFALGKNVPKMLDLFGFDGDFSFGVSLTAEHRDFVRMTYKLDKVSQLIDNEWVKNALSYCSIPEFSDGENIVVKQVFGCMSDLLAAATIVKGVTDAEDTWLELAENILELPEPAYRVYAYIPEITTNKKIAETINYDDIIEVVFEVSGNHIVRHKGSGIERLELNALQKYAESIELFKPGVCTSVDIANRELAIAKKGKLTELAYDNLLNSVLYDLEVNKTIIAMGLNSFHKRVYNGRDTYTLREEVKQPLIEGVFKSAVKISDLFRLKENGNYLVWFEDTEGEEKGVYSKTEVSKKVLRLVQQALGNEQVVNLIRKAVRALIGYSLGFEDDNFAVDIELDLDREELIVSGVFDTDSLKLDNMEVGYALSLGTMKGSLPDIYKFSLT